jgi:biopolymer transport protein ExbD
VALRWQFKPRNASSTIGLTSLMDVMTILLVFMLVNFRSKAAPEILGQGTLPIVSSLAAGAPESDLRDAISIVVTPTEIRVGDSQVALTGPVDSTAIAFADALARERNRDGRTRSQMVVQADARTPYSEIDRLVRAASRLGITRLRFVARHGGER